MNNLTPSLAEIIEWDVQNWSRALHFWQTHSTQTVSHCSALEIGCSKGGLSLWMALQGAQVVCSDITDPTAKTVQKHRQYNLSPLIRYETIDATNIPYTEHFDIVFFKSVLGGIGRNDHKELQAKTLQEIYKSLKVGGELWFAENLVASPVHQFLRQRFVRWGQSWRYISKEEMQEWLLPFSQVTYSTAGVLGSFGRTERQRQVLGYLDKWLLNSIVPDRWKYILFGVAKK